MDPWHFFSKVFCWLLFEGTFTSVLQVKSHNEVSKAESRVFYSFCLMMEGSGSVPIMTDPDPRGPKKLRISDPQHWSAVCCLWITNLEVGFVMDICYTVCVTVTHEWARWWITGSFNSYYSLFLSCSILIPAFLHDQLLHCVPSWSVPKLVSLLISYYPVLLHDQFRNSCSFWSALTNVILYDPFLYSGSFMTSS